MPSLLVDALRTAIFLNQQIMSDLPQKTLIAIARGRAGDVLTEGVDEMIFGGRRCGLTFNRLAKAMAAASLIYPKWDIEADLDRMAAHELQARAD